MDALHEVQGPNPKYFFWTGNGKAKSVVADAQRSFRKLFELANVEGYPHMFRDTFAVELLKRGVSLEIVSMLLGHASIRVTEKHYKPWVKTLQDKLETDAMKGWPQPRRSRKARAPKRQKSTRAERSKGRHATLVSRVSTR